MTIKAESRNLDKINKFITSELELLNCDNNLTNQILLSCEEVFSNICNYAYKNGVGFVTVYFKTILKERIIITFSDNGIPYNPIEQKDPDIEVNVKKRPIGGLGIFIIRNMMDKVYYTLQNGKNIFTMEKKIS